MKFDESVFSVCPPRSKLKPSYCLVFELFELKNGARKQDRIVAWTVSDFNFLFLSSPFPCFLFLLIIPLQAMPMCNEHFAVLVGKFKLPLLKGEHGPHAAQHYKSMESAIAEDLNTWLCNMYIEIRHGECMILSHLPYISCLTLPSQLFAIGI